MTKWRLVADKKPALWQNVICWREGWPEPQALMWKTNDRITRAVAEGHADGMVDTYFGDPNESDDYELARPENWPTHWMPLPKHPNPLSKEKRG
jgi:hypothetical protein